MKTGSLAAALLACACACAQAHDYPVYPVKVRLYADAHRIRAEIKSNAVYLREIVLGQECTETVWSAAARAKAQDYINQCLGLNADGVRLYGSLASYRYVEVPFFGEKGMLLYFTMDYPLAKPCSALGVSSMFFPEYRTHMLSHADGDEEEVLSADFSTVLRTTGRNRAAEVLTYDRPSVKFAFSGIMITAGQSLARAFFGGLEYPVSELFILLFLALAVIYLIPAANTAGMAASVAAAALAFAGGMRLPAGTAALLLCKCACLAAVSLALIFSRRRAAGIFLLAAAAVWGIDAGKRFSGQLLPEAFHSPCGALFFLGWGAAAVAAALVMALALAADRKHLLRRSESLAARLFAQHLKFTELIIAVAAVFAAFGAVKK